MMNLDVLKKKETLLISFKGIRKSSYIYGTLGPYVLGEERYHCYFFFLINQNQQKILFEQGHYCHLLRIYKPSEKDFLSTLIGF